MFDATWDDLPEVEVLPNNYRRSVCGLEVGINLIRWEHPSGTPAHVHDDSEKAVIVIDGSMEWLIGGDTVLLQPGTVVVVPQGFEHSGWTIGVDVRFYEAFASGRIQNLVGFLGQGLLPPARGAASQAGLARRSGAEP